MKRTFPCLLLLCTASLLSGMWMSPPDEVMGTSADGSFLFKRDNRFGKITVYSKDKTDPLWDVTLKDFHELFSKVYLSDDGTWLLHLRGNHIAFAPDHVAVEVIRKDGEMASLPVKRFIDQPVRPAVMSSVSPPAEWLKSFVGLTEKGFELVNAKGETILVNMEQLDFVKP